MTRLRYIVVTLGAALVALHAWTQPVASQPAAANPPAGHHQLLVVLDGLRPDYITREGMPALAAFAERGVVFTNHHSVFPTVTRVNASSIASGRYPAGHGLMGNTVFFPQVDPFQFLNTESRANMEKVQASTGGRLLTTPTLGPLLQAAGKKLVVVSAGSGGAAYLLNDKLAGGAIINVEYTLPDSLHAQVVKQLGDADAATMSPGAKNTRTVDAFLKVALGLDPSVVVLWLTDPDTTAHDKGIGHPETAAALKALDGEINRLLTGLAERKLTETWNVWFTSDHGFSTSVGAANLSPVLDPYNRTLADGGPRIVASGGALYVRDGDRPTIDAIARGLQRTPGVGAIFMPASAAGSSEGRVVGTLSYDLIRWNHERSADILFAADWTDAPNAYGFKGTSAVNGVANHGNTSPWDVHNILVAAGPDIKTRTQVTTPSANVDFAPTFLRLLGVAVPGTMDGRILDEALRQPFSRASTQVSAEEHTVVSVDKRYSLTAHFSTVRRGESAYRYFDWAKATRP